MSISRITFLFVFAFASRCYAQSIPLIDCGLTYFYDASGNRIIRMVVPCGGGGTGRLRDTTQTANSDEITGLKEDTLGDFQIVLMAPNPTGGPFKVTCNQDLVDADVSISDLQGRVVSQTTVSGREVPLDISHLAAGSYSVVVTTQYGRTGKSIVKASQK